MPNTIPLNQALLQEAEELLDSIGLTVDDYCNLAIRQLLITRRIPFEMVAPSHLPSKQPNAVQGETRNLVRKMYALAEQLERLHEGRHFTPDGHMVGSIGEVIAEQRYDLTLYEASHPVHDGWTPDERQVQIKTTQTSSVAISEQPDYLIVLKLDGHGDCFEIYNGPGEPAWQCAGKRSKTGQRRIAINKLIELNEHIALLDRIPRRQAFSNPSTQ